MRTGIFVTMIAVLLPASAPAGEILAPAYSEFKPLPVDAASGVTLSARLKLEMRRAGGPRRDILESILLAGRRDNTAWAGQVTELCHEGVIDCGRFLAFVEALPDRVLPTQRESAISKAECVKEEAYLQALPMKQRQALYRQAIVTGHSITDLGPWLSADECALRALHDGMDELIPDIERGLSGSLRSNRESIERALRLRKALIAPSPPEALLKLIRHGVELDVEHSLLPADKMPADSRPFDAEIGFAGQALAELRRLNPPGVAERLEVLYALYKPAEEKLGREREELLAKEKEGKVPPAFPPRNVSRAKGLSGGLALRIVETIGDLGDRDFERAVFKDRLDGLPTLWDRVQQVEDQLVKQGKMKASDMVSGEQQ